MVEDPVSIRTYAERIQSHWHRATASIMEVARICAEANRKLSAAQKRELVKLLPFSAPQFSKLSKIGSDPRLQSARVQKLLPPNHSIIYAVAQLDNAELKAAMDGGIVRPTLKRAELQEWLQEKNFRRKPDSSPTVNLPDTLLCRNPANG